MIKAKKQPAPAAHDKTALFETMPVGNALLTMAVPTIVSQLITMIYNLADTFFIGMTNDHYCYEDSIICQGWTETQELSELDWLMLNLMYHPALEPGMTAEEAEGILMNIIE